MIKNTLTKGDLLEFKIDIAPFLTMKTIGEVIKIREGKATIQFRDGSRKKLSIKNASKHKKI